MNWDNQPGIPGDQLNACAQLEIMLTLYGHGIVSNFGNRLSEEETRTWCTTLTPECESCSLVVEGPTSLFQSLTFLILSCQIFATAISTHVIRVFFSCTYPIYLQKWKIQRYCVIHIWITSAFDGAQCLTKKNQCNISIVRPIYVSAIVADVMAPGPRLNIKTVLSTYGDFHVKDKTAVRTSYL